MSVRRSAGAIFWGLTLMAIGALLLARNMGYSIPVWGYIARYWPALLIAWGLLKFVDYYRFKRSGDNRPLFSGGEVALLILIIFAGTAVTTAANISPGFGTIFDIGDIDLWDITGNNFTFEEHEEAPVPSDSNLEIINLYGNVEVRPSDSDRVVLDVNKTIRASNKDEAEQLSKDFTFSIRNTGSAYRIASNRDDGLELGRGRDSMHVLIPRQRYKSSLVVQVPRRSILRVDNRNGRVKIQDLAGNQQVFNRYGQVDVRNISGGVQVENRNGSVTVQDVSESVKINNRYSVTAVKNIGGNVELDTRNGSVDVSGVTGSARISNSYAPISVENVQGDLTITGRNNSVDVEHVGGNLKADNSYQNVNIRDAKGAVTVNSHNGDLVVSFVKPPDKNISISTRYGNVTLEFPSNSSFTIDAQTEFGQIDSEFAGLGSSRSNRERSLTGRVGQGGPQIKISARNGDIHLERKG
jgi:DUF4097 and DUF4098 domain-containing protein YvlB